MSIRGGRSWAKTSKKKFEKSHSAENCRTVPETPYFILIHCETIPYLYALHYPNILPSYLHTLTNLYPILIHCRNYTLF